LQPHEGIQADVTWADSHAAKVMPPLVDHSDLGSPTRQASRMTPAHVTFCAHESDLTEDPLLSLGTPAPLPATVHSLALASATSFWERKRATALLARSRAFSAQPYPG
jgi:hypothetical protein